MELSIRKVGKFVEIKVNHDYAVFDLGFFNKAEAAEFISEIDSVLNDLKEWIDEK